VQVSGFEEAYEAEYVRMVRVAAMLTGSTARAEQVVQDAYVALHPRFDSAADPAEELYRAVVEAGRSPGGAGVPPAALADLTPQGRAVLVLRYYAGLHPTEIAAVLGRSVGTVQATLDAAGDEPGHRQRLASLAVTIPVRPGWVRICDRLDVAPALARRRGVLVPSRLGRLAGAAAAVVLAAAVVVARQDGGGMETARDTASTTTTTRLRAPSAIATSTAAAPPADASAATAPGALLAPAAATGTVPPYDMSHMLDLLGLGRTDGAADVGDDVAAGDEEIAGGDRAGGSSSPSGSAGQPQPGAGPAVQPSELPDTPPVAETPPTTALARVRTPVPPERGPDGWLVNQSTFYGNTGWFIVTYNVEDDDFSFAEWIVDEYAEPVAVDSYSFTLRPGQNCLVTGAATDPYPRSQPPHRFVAGVVRSDVVRVDVIGGLSGGDPELDFEQSGRAALGNPVAPGLLTWMTTVDYDYLRVEVRDADGKVIHTANEAQREAFPATC
jgi:hypothetical protein